MKAEEITRSALGHIDVRRKAPKQMWKTAKSLKPGLSLMERLVIHPDPNSIAVRDAWAFVHPWRYATEEEWARRNEDVFIGFNDDDAPTPGYYKQLTSKEVKSVVAQYKKECQVCGETFPQALEFHHRDPSNKLFEISQFYGLQRQYKRSLKELIEEIDKCDVLCANCHRKESYGGNQKS